MTQRNKLNWKTYARLCRTFWESNVFAGPFITAGLNQQGRAESSDKLYCIRVYVILNLFLLLSTILSLFLPTIIIKSNVKTLEGKERLLNAKSG